MILRVVWACHEYSTAKQWNVLSTENASSSGKKKRKSNKICLQEFGHGLPTMCDCHNYLLECCSVLSHKTFPWIWVGTAQKGFMAGVLAAFDWRASVLRACHGANWSNGIAKGTFVHKVNTIIIIIIYEWKFCMLIKHNFTDFGKTTEVTNSNMHTSLVPLHTDSGKD